MDDDEREVALKPSVDGADRFDQVAVVDGLQEVGDDLGVGLRAERMPAGFELVLQLAIVLDDAVEDDRKLPFVAARERMRVVLGHRAVRRPARVTEPRRRMRSIRTRSALEVREVSDRTHVIESVVFEQRDPGRVVAAELEALEAGDQ